MQKGQKHVIKIILLSLFLSLNSFAQTKENDYSLVSKVIELTNTSQDSIYNLNKHVSINREKLKKYYLYRFENKPFYKRISYDKVKDSFLYDSKEKYLLRWNLKCAPIDSLFSENDIKRFIKPKEKSNWDEDMLNKLMKDKTIINYVIRGNYISKPYYRMDNKYAIVLHHLKATTTMFIFKKENNKWENISQIDNLWW